MVGSEGAGDATSAAAACLRPPGRSASVDGRIAGALVPRETDAHRADAGYGRGVSITSLLARPVTRARVPFGDVLAATMLMVAAQAQVWLDPDLPGLRWGVALQCAVAVGAVVVRRRPPVAVAIVVVAALVDVLAYRTGETPNVVVGLLLALLLVCYSVARHEPRADLALAGGLVLLAAFWLGDWRQSNPPSEYLTSFVSLSSAWIAGRVAWHERAQAKRLQLALAEAERQRLRAEKAAASAERSRIAREVHDVVAHSLSVVAVQADAAEALVPRDPGAAARRMGVVRDTAREALGEMRRVLGTLREGSHAAAPQPSVGHLAALTADLRDAGVEIALRVEGEPSTLPPAVDMSAFRIVQEGLTNVRRHAPGARAEVILRYTPAALELAIINNGGPPALGHDAQTAGYGLIGVRERVNALGGEFQVGPTDGGWRLHAVLPLKRT